MKKFSSSAGASTTDSVSVAGSRYFGGSSSVVGGIGLMSARESVTTTDSFTDEHHTMTKAELEYQPSELEHQLIDEVTAEVKERVVFGQGSTTWGLKWECGTVDDPAHLLGGWLSQVSRSILSSGVSNGNTRFCVLDDEHREFQQCLDERLKVRRSITYEEMHTVRSRCQENKKDGKPEAWYIQVFGKGVRWELMPVNKLDRDLILRWTAALQFRSGSYDPSISGDAMRARKAAVWAQSKYRMWKAKQRVQRRRDRKNALVNRLAAAIGMDGWGLGDSDDEDEDGGNDGGFLETYKNQVYDAGASVVNTAWAAVGSWLGLGGLPTTVPEEEEEAKESPSSTSTTRRGSIQVQFSNDLPPLQPGEVEDEMWENQRWTPATGWSTKTLGKTERCPFTDRLGRGNFSKEGGVPLPAGWEAKSSWQLDLSAVNKGRCDKEGFCYSLDWPLLDADFARGRFVITQGPRDFVRRRRWYRRRVCANESNLLDTTSPILMHGWLGSKSPGTGRWNTRMFVLTRPGLRIGEALTKFPAITQFRFSFKEYEAVLENGGVDGAKWRALTDKQCTTVELDPRLCVVDETVANGKYPGYFCLVLDGKQRKRQFNANDSGGREAWANAIRTALEDALKSKRPRTMRLVGGAFETTSYPTIIMDSLLLAPIDAVEEAFFQSPSVVAAVNIRSGFQQPSVSSWNGNTKTITYTDNARGGQVNETWIRARTEPGRGFVVDRRIEAPHAQFGDEHAIKCRFVLIAAEMLGEPACRVLVSVDVEFTKPTMMIGYITSEARKALTVSLREIWLPAVVGYLQGKGMLMSQPLGDGTKIAWGVSQLGTSHSKKFGKQDSGQIEVGKI